LMVGIGLGVNIWYMARAVPNRNKPAWMFVLALLALKVAAQLSAVFLPETLWLGQHGLRVLYLHLLLLGFVSTLFFVAIHSVFSKSSRAGLYMFMGTVLILLSTLVLISGLWPTEWLPNNIYLWVTIGALLPSVAILFELGIVSIRNFRRAI